MWYRIYYVGDVKRFQLHWGRRSATNLQCVAFSSATPPPLQIRRQVSRRMNTARV